MQNMHKMMGFKLIAAKPAELRRVMADSGCGWLGFAEIWRRERYREPTVSDPVAPPRRNAKWLINKDGNRCPVAAGAAP